MHSIVIREVTPVQNFLSLCDSKYVDALFNDGYVELITNNEEVFGYLTLPVESSIGDKDFKCRIPFNSFKGLLMEGKLQVMHEDNTIRLMIYDKFDTISCDVTFTNQDVYTLNYSRKLEIAREKHKIKDTLNLKHIKNLIKVGCATGSIFNVNNGVACIQTPDRLRVYQKINANFDFAVRSASLQKLAKCSTDLHSIENYVMSSNGDLTVIVTKVKLYSNNEFDEIMSCGSKFKCSIDFSGLRSFIMKMKPKADTVVLDFIRNCSVIEVDRLKYTIPLQIEDKVFGHGADMSELIIPMAMLNSILGSITTTKFSLEKKKFFTSLCKDDLIIVF